MGSRRLNLMLQKILLDQSFRQASCRISRGELRWRGTLQPTPLSQRYVVDVTYKLGSAPRVFVIHPSLQQRDGAVAPHLYRDGSLCLFLPNAGEWTESMALAETTIPWASEWLLHYEVWLGTGEWTGGGAHPKRP